ncbi:MAG: hypothetical protein IID35_03520 [Planctomycetes bacterium]|nr:hypothetical protein [Planctomycetota bacterium]
MIVGSNYYGFTLITDTETGEVAPFGPSGHKLAYMGWLPSRKAAIYQINYQYREYVSRVPIIDNDRRGILVNQTRTLMVVDLGTAETKIQTAADALDRLTRAGRFLWTFTTSLAAPPKRLDGIISGFCSNNKATRPCQKLSKGQRTTQSQAGYRVKGEPRSIRKTEGKTPDGSPAP